MVGVDEVRSRIERALPGARVSVTTYRGDDHFRAEVAAPQFAGKSRVEQHRMVHAALTDLLGGEMHALSLTTHPIAPPGECP